VKPGEVIPFRYGEPDFSKWSRGNYRVKGMTGKHEDDMPLIREHIARQFGWYNKRGEPDANRVQDWLNEENLIPHHAGGTKVQLIPAPLHGCPAWDYQGVRHTGGAKQQRDKNSRKKDD
jgi:hypothetical protein